MGGGDDCCLVQGGGVCRLWGKEGGRLGVVVVQDAQLAAASCVLTRQSSF
jgi:hypothetical protein